MNRAYRIASLHMLVANDRARVAWLGVMLDEFPDDCLPDNFHAQCVLARQILRSREDELAELLTPAAAAAHPKSGLAGSLVTSGAAQPAATF